MNTPGLDKWLPDPEAEPFFGLDRTYRPQPKRSIWWKIKHWYHWRIRHRLEMRRNYRRWAKEAKAARTGK